MTRPRIRNLAGVALAGALAAGCGTSAPARFYTLSSTAAASQALAPPVAIVVGPVTVPAAVDRPQIVLQSGPNRLELDEFNRWAAPLGDTIARAVAGDLAVLLGTPEVGSAPGASFDPEFRVTIDVERFESVAGDHALVDAVWAVHETAGGRIRRGRTTAREPARGEGIEALAAAHSQALGRLSADIAVAIREVAAQSPPPGARRGLLEPPDRSLGRNIDAG